MNKKIPEKQFVLGVGIDDVNLDQAVKIVQDWLSGKGKHYIVTPNLEFIMATQNDLEFKNILNKADLAIPDGKGLKLSGKIKNTVAGVDLMEKLCELSEEFGFTTGFLGGRNRVAKKTSECLQKKYSGLKVAFAEEGPEVKMDGNVIARGPAASVSQVRPRSSPAGESLAVGARDLSSASPLAIPPCDILFVGFGAVKQEKWIAKNLPILNVKIAMGVGGSFDEISGKVLRCPKWIQKIGLKWLFRLIQEPWRIKRQLVLLKFFWLVLFHKNKN